MPVVCGEAVHGLKATDSHLHLLIPISNTIARPATMHNLCTHDYTLHLLIVVDGVDGVVVVV